MGDTVDIMPDAEPTHENVDNTNVIHRALVAALATDGGADISAVVESLAAEGRICEADVDAAAAKGWVDAKQVGALKANMAKPAPAETANAALREAERAALDNADNL